MPRAALAALLEVIAATPQHSYLLTTRQPARLAQLLAGSPDPARGTNWPLTNLRLGIHVHAADQATLTDPTLQPSTGLWLDARRLHAPVDITGLLTSERIAFVLTDPLPAQPTWIHQAWAKDVVDQCQRAGVSCLPATGPTPARRTRPSLIRQCRPDAAADLHQTPALIPAATH
jgi:protein gp37